jgi:glutathione synthase/RimK-type ligase-like ATP-grasp enzyme
MKKGKIYHSHEIYEEAAKHYGLTICYFTLSHIKNQTSIMALKKNNKSKGFMEEMVKIPKVVCNRVSLKKKRTREKLEYLLESGSQVFNAIPFQNGKDKINRLLEKELDLIDYLPKTLTGTIQNLEMMMDHYDSLFIKPVFSSLGKGIMYLEKQAEGSWILYERKKAKQKWKETHFTNKLPKKLKDSFRKRSFIIQEKIPLATYKKRPFDLRVIVQKNSNGDWDITGIIGKLAPQDEFITNVDQGGVIGTLKDYTSNLEASYSDILKNISILSLKIAEVLESHYQHIGDLGLDIGLTTTGKPYFIECNLRGQYAGLREYKKMKSLWKEIHFTLIGYSSYLLNKNKI